MSSPCAPGSRHLRPSKLQIGSEVNGFRSTRRSLNPVSLECRSNPMSGFSRRAACHHKSSFATCEDFNYIFAPQCRPQISEQNWRGINGAFTEKTKRVDRKGLVVAQGVYCPLRQETCEVNRAMIDDFEKSIVFVADVGIIDID